jgi:rRNA maturation endonuclease Nob1
MDDRDTYQPDWQFVCERCHASFQWRQVVHSERGDDVCPRCGGLRLMRTIPRLGKFKRFLHYYNMF